MDGHDQVVRCKGNLIDSSLLKPHPPAQPGPGFFQYRSQRTGAFGDAQIDGHRFRGAVIEKQQGPGQKAVAASQIDHSPSAETAPHPASRLPGLEQLFSRQAPGMADGPGEAVEQGVPTKP
jgi:hypothetical protein